MIEAQTLDTEILNVTEDVTFTPLELKFFALELKDMISEGKLNLKKAVHNARYWAEIERRTERMKAGHYVEFADEEWKKFINDKDFEVVIMGNYKVQLAWDNESKVWTATSEDIPGLILEDESADKLIQRVILAAPEIIELNGVERVALA